MFIAVIVCTIIAFSVFSDDVKAFDAGGGATSTPTVTLELTKKFSGSVPDGYTADMFSFLVNGGSVSNETVTLTEYTADTAVGTIELSEGTYTIEEVGPIGFVPAEWLPGWYGQCDSGSGFSTTLTIDENNIDYGTLYCQVDNQWRYATLRVIKEFVGTSTAPENFEFKVTQGDLVKYDGPFNEQGDNTVIMGGGDYKVEETVYANFTPSYSGDCDENGEGTLAFEGAATCTITNTYNPPNYSQSSYYSQGSYGGGNEGPEYLVYGYVWHDENSNMCWEGKNCSQEEATTTEPDLDGWTVKITNGEVTMSTTTDAEGYYSFMVPAGTWTISEVVQSNWNQTFPNDNTHVVVVGTVTEAESESLFASIMHLIIPVALAQTPETYGPYNFGNVFTGSSYSQGSYGGGSYSQGSYGGGNGKKIELSESSGGGGSADPVPEVAGEQVTIIPAGPVNAGSGGASPIEIPRTPLIAGLLTLARRKSA